MGIVNINDDSFCADGSLDLAVAGAQAVDQIRAGADIIDIGAESARTNRAAISEEEEIARLVPFVQTWVSLLNSVSPLDADQLWPPLLSINTWRTRVIESVLPFGGDLINDISASVTSANASACAGHDAALLIMHSVGEPKIPHTHVGYDDVMNTLETFFESKIALAVSGGLSVEHLLIDPGIDFAKQCTDNLIIYRDMARLRRFDRPILLPVSRKTVIGNVLDQSNPLDRDPGTIACLTSGMERGAHIFRVHNVGAAVQAVKVLYAISSFSLRR
jgi:dihydropteroate synthase